MPRHRLQWVEGLVLRKIEACGAQPGYSLSERAEKAFQRARAGFIQLRAPWEIALVGLDQAALYRSLNRWDDLFAIAYDTLQRFRELSGNTQAVVALSFCVDAARARAGATAAIVTAQGVIAARAARSPSPTGSPARTGTTTRSHRPSRSTPSLRSTPTPRPDPPKVQKRRRDAAKTREALLAATFEEIHRSGFGSARNVQRILSSVGVTKGAIKHHFGDKQGLGDAVVDELAHDRVLTEWVRPIDAADDPIDAIGAALKGVLEDNTALGALSNLARSLDLEDSARKGRAKTARQRITELYVLWHEALARNLARGQRQGTVRDDVVPQAVAACLISLYEGSIGLAHGSQKPELVEMNVREIMRYLDTLRP